MKVLYKTISFIILILLIVYIGNINSCVYASESDDIFSGADSFIRSGENSVDINEGKLKETTDFLYDLLLGAGIIVAVAVGIVLGIKFMIGSVEEKAEYKQALVIYAVGCVVLFGAFGIWQIVVNVLNQI